MRYDFHTKTIYRQRRDATVDQFCRVPLALRRVAYLDTGAALDTQHRLRLGYRPENLYAVNGNPAEVAMLTMTLDKLGLPRVNTCGVDFVRALDERAPLLHVIDFDGVSNLHDGFGTLMVSLAQRVTRPTILAATILAGREAGFNGTAIKSLAARSSWTCSATSFGTPVSARHYQRLRLLWLYLSGGQRDTDQRFQRCLLHATDAKWDIYISASGQAMLWVVLQVRPHDPRMSTKSIRAAAGTGYVPDASTRVSRLGLVPPCVLKELLGEAL